MTVTKKTVCGQARDDERAFYGTSDTRFTECVIAGEADGESAFKECKNIDLSSCRLALRYPLWHVDGCNVYDSDFEETCRAPIWYCKNVHLNGSRIRGVKALRECENVVFDKSSAVSTEFGWKTRGFTAYNSDIEGEYLFLDSSDISLDGVKIKGKYSFQYVKDAIIKNSVLDTKDAFWHSENVTVYDSVVSGEYLGWYSKNLRLVRCKIRGTQPLCYAQGLVLEDCTMDGCDLSFEMSEVDASVIGDIESIKNPKFGRIAASGVGTVISDAGRERKTLLSLDGGDEVYI